VWGTGAWIALAVGVLLVSPALGDGPQTGTVDGRVSDAEGHALPGVTITLAGPQGEQQATTKDDGEFRFVLVPPGDYTVGATLEGLGSQELAVSIEGGQRRTIALTLKGTSAESVTVTSEAPLVDKYAVGASAALESAVAENLAFKARNYQSSVEVLPSVVHDATSRAGADVAFSVNGGQQNENSGFVDGVDTSFARFNGSSRALLPSSVLEEVRVESAGFGVEYGRMVSGVSNAVVKSGTNDFHGAFVYIPQSEKWRAPYDELDLDRNDDIINSYEASLGGPMVKNRAWFFAAHASQDTNEIDLLADGSTENVGFQNDVSLVKLNFQPTSRHYLSALWVDSPIKKVQINPNGADQFTPCACDLPGEIGTVTWGYSISSSLFLETKIAHQKNQTLRDSLRRPEIVPGANPDSPNGNQFSYQDRANNFRYNAIAQNPGEGYLEIPRDQANASLAVFHGAHELKFGADYQDVDMKDFNDIGKRYQGLGFNRALPGGFTTPQFVDVFDAGGERSTSSDLRSAYAQDRIGFGDHWVLQAGLRVDDQSATNDVGQEAESYTKWAPRASATYDLHADGKLLLKANAGRYYQNLSQDLISREFTREADGTNTFTRFAWNPATQRYDRFQSRTVPALNTAIQAVDPYYKDEAVAGVSWQFAHNWAFEADAVWWELSDLFWSTDQFNAAGAIYRDVRNWDDGFRKYRGLQLQANRAFRSGWTLRTNYTTGKNTGNMFGANANTLDDDDLFEALGGVEVGTGRTDATSVNRSGRGPNDRVHNLNVSGVKQWSIGEQTLSLGGYFGFRSGERWGLRPNTMVRHPVSGQIITTSTYRQPRDAEQMEDTYTLNLAGNWSFPIKGVVRGRVGVEAANATNEQEIIGINIVNGRPQPGKFAFQAPRELRLQAGITF
jgi:hypothetical protein